MAGERILIVEDERAVARGLEYALAKEGFAVLWAETGQQALDLARTRDPHLIVLDIRLPDISGFDVCRQLRAERMRQPILMLTACDEELDKVLGLELGADDYVVKPYSLRELISRIRALLRRAYGELAAASVGVRSTGLPRRVTCSRSMSTSTLPNLSTPSCEPVASSPYARRRCARMREISSRRL